VIFLSADAYGVLPPVARLDDDQIRFYFLSGYTAKVAGTERESPSRSRSSAPAFAAPFLVLPPETYADMLIDRVNRHQAQVWMLNTGWVGGPYGVGKRMSIAHTRAIVSAVVEGRLRDVPAHVDPIFGLHIPDRVPVFRPRCWTRAALGPIPTPTTGRPSSSDVCSRRTSTPSARTPPPPDKR